MTKRVSSTARNTMLAIVLLGAGFFIGTMLPSNADVLANQGQPGSVTDPLVTKSYVDEKVANLVKQELKNQTGAAQTEIKVIQVKPGQILYAGAGAEFIVRNGHMVAVSNSSNGIPDVTAGKDILNGERVENNHLLVFPAEGRGVMPHEDQTGTIYVMVRGDYLIVEN